MPHLTSYQFHNYVLLRTPAYSFKQYETANIHEILKDDYFLDALTHASESLISTVRKSGFNTDNLSEKSRLSILKYYNRMCFRPTPFGTMAALSAVRWSEKEKSIVLSSDRKKSVQPNFSQTIHQGLQLLTSGSKASLIYEINPTMYGNQWQRRYIKYTADEKENKRVFNIETVSIDDTLKKIFSFMSTPRAHATLAAFIAETFRVNETDAFQFIESMADAQVIRCLQEPNITGQNYIRRMVAFRGMISVPQEDMNREMYVNMTRPVQHGALPNELQGRITDGLYATSKLNSSISVDTQESFKQKFRQKFEERTVPVLEALDPELGLDYFSLAAGHTQAALLTDVNIQSPGAEHSQTDWTEVHSLLLNKWPTAKDQTIILTDDDLEEINPQNDVVYPNSMSVLFRVIDNLLFIESAGNASANALIGRFTVLDPDCQDAAKDIAAIEEQANPEVIFAEIAHFSHLHAANIEQRASLYRYEIPIVCGSEYDDDHRVLLSDLELSLVGNTFILTSRRLKKRVIPRMSSALNYGKSDLSVFRFLCDLQHQGLKSSFNFNLEYFFPGLQFYPRVQYKNTVLSLACWNITCTQNCTNDSVKALAERLQWPRYVSINQHDHQLVFDLTSDHDLAFLSSFFKENKTVAVKEFPFAAAQNSLVVDQNHQPYIAQFVTSLFHRETIYQPYFPKTVDEQVKRRFLPGDTWLYLKIYCTPVRGNEILTRTIAPCIHYLEEHECIDGFFFVRYTDPDFHIRVRLRLSNDFSIGAIMKVIRQHLKPYADQGLISRYMLDSYERELERYHPMVIDAAENFFCRSSALVLSYLREETADDLDIRYNRIAFAGVQMFLDAMKLTPEETMELFKTLFFSFSSEFSLTNTLKQELSDKYRVLTNTNFLRNLVSFESNDRLSEPIRAYINAAELLQAAADAHHPTGRTKLISDMIHMHLNRCFTDDPRRQELVFHYCMNRHYMSICARKNALLQPGPSVS